MKKGINKSDVEKIASLAKINIEDKKLDKLKTQLNDILEYFSKLDEVDTEDYGPKFDISELSNVFRKDRIKESLTIDEVMEGGKNKDNYFKSPRVEK